MPWWTTGRRYFHYGEQRDHEAMMLLLASEERKLGLSA